MFPGVIAHQIYIFTLFYPVLSERKIFNINRLYEHENLERFLRGFNKIFHQNYKFQRKTRYTGMYFNKLLTFSSTLNFCHIQLKYNIISIK